MLTTNNTFMGSCRDFANGFLVAEILSRYFPKEIEMHNYDTGISLVKKKDNWSLIEKFLKVPHIFTNVREGSSLVDHPGVC